jgi:NADH-quinone oxidoreductase subunit G
MHADRTVFEPPPPADPDAPLSPSMEGYYGPKAAPATLPFAWAAGWDSEQAVNKFQQEIAGPTIGGDAGVRLIDDNPGAAPDYFPPPAAAPAAPDHDWPVVPLHHVFGSEELSAEAAAVRELCPGPYVALRPEDAERLGATEGAPLRLAIGDRTVALPAAFRPDLPPGTLGLPAGLPGTEGLVLPARARPVPS